MAFDYRPLLLRSVPLRHVLLAVHRLMGRDAITVARPMCHLCGARAGFAGALGHTLFREARCNACGASLRTADTARLVVRTLLGEDLPLASAAPRLAAFTILEGQAAGPLHRHLSGSPGYTCFEYWPEVPPGDYKDGVMCNDFERLTFADETFDMVISQDVFEHLPHPDRALAEIARVLKPNGAYVFTVPLHEGRATRSREGLPAVAHLDPLRDGAPVYTDWGDDLPVLCARHGLITTRHDLHRFHQPAEITDVDATYEAYRTTAPMAYYRYNSVVFVALKRR
jgi:SAM-dependent methyltransferase